MLSHTAFEEDDLDALQEADFDWSGFQWIDFNDTDNSVIAYLGKSPTAKSSIVCVCV